MTHRMIAILAALALLFGGGVPAASAQGSDAFYREVVFFPSAAITADTTTAEFRGFSGADLLAVKLNCTAVSGTTPTLDTTVQRSIDGGATWDALFAFTQRTAAGSQVIVYADVRSATPQIIGDRLRVFLDVGGTSPSFTCSVAGIAEG